MHQAVIYDLHGATYKFCSSDFRWCYKSAISYVKDVLRRYPEYYMITVHLGIYHIDVYRGFYDIWRVE